MINQRDENGNRNGHWEWYYENGQLLYKCEYRHGKVYGLWEDYWSNGQISYKGEYKNKKKIGLWYYSLYDK